MEESTDKTQAPQGIVTAPLTDETLIHRYFEEEKPSWFKQSGTLWMIIGGLVAFLTLGWYLLTHEKTSVSVAELTLVEAETTPYKVKPAEPGGMVVPNMDKTIYDTIAEGSKTPSLPKVERLMPTPEEPVLSRTQIEATPSSAVPPTLTLEGTGEPALAPHAEKPLATGTLEELAISPSTPPLSVEKDVVIKSHAAQEKPRKARVAPKSQALAWSGYGVQLAAFKSEHEAKKEWAHLKHAFPTLLKDLSPAITRVNLPGKGVFYRLQAGPIRNEEAGRLLCSKLIARKQGCFVVKGH